LFADGRFRFDYPGVKAEGGAPAFLGYSLGTGPTGYSAAAPLNTTAVPSSSIQFTPNRVEAGGPLAAGQETLSLPAGSSLVPSDPSCVATVVPTASQDGLATCQIPALAPGAEVGQTVTFAMPENAIGQPRPENLRYLGTYRSGSLVLTDGDELDELSGGQLFSTHITVNTAYKPPPANPVVGQPANFPVTISGGAFDKPSVTFSLPANTTLQSIRIAGADLHCDPTTAGQVTCPLPSGLQELNPLLTVTVIPTLAAVGTELTLGVSAQALNAPTATATAKSPPVEA
jgi:hypothetical protein